MPVVAGLAGEWFKARTMKGATIRTAAMMMIQALALLAGFGLSAESMGRSVMLVGGRGRANLLRWRV